MSTYESPLGNKKMPQSNLREFTVPDASNAQGMNPTNSPLFANLQNFADSIPDMPEQQPEVRRTSNVERLNTGAKKRIEMLIGMTKTVREVTIEGNIYVLQSLKAKDMREVMISASAFDQTVQVPYEMRKQILARSLIQIAGTDIELLIGTNDFNMKLAVIDELDEALLNRLYNEYGLLREECDKKYSIKTEQDVKEVINDLKK